MMQTSTQSLCVFVFVWSCCHRTQKRHTYQKHCSLDDVTPRLRLFDCTAHGDLSCLSLHRSVHVPPCRPVHSSSTTQVLSTSLHPNWWQHFTYICLPKSNVSCIRLPRLAAKTIYIQRKKSQFEGHSQDSIAMNLRESPSFANTDDEWPRHFSTWSVLHVFYGFTCAPIPCGELLRSRDMAGRGGRSLSRRPSQRVVGVAARSLHGVPCLVSVRQKGGIHSVST